MAIPSCKQSDTDYYSTLFCYNLLEVKFINYDQIYQLRSLIELHCNLCIRLRINAIFLLLSSSPSYFTHVYNNLNACHLDIERAQCSLMAEQQERPKLPERAIASAVHSPCSIEFRPATIRSVVNDKQPPPPLSYRQSCHYPSIYCRLLLIEMNPLTSVSRVARCRLFPLPFILRHSSRVLSGIKLMSRIHHENQHFLLKLMLAF